MYIENVKFLNDYIIEIILSGNHSFFYDLKSQLHNARFKNIHNPSKFKAGYLEGCSIVWNGSCRLEDYEILGFDLVESELYCGRKKNSKMAYASA